MIVEGGASVLPFVRQFHGSPSAYWWDDDGGLTREIALGEDDEQGDVLMSLSFSFGLPTFPDRTIAFILP